MDLTTLPSLLGKEDPVILDIGCNDGEHTLQFLGLFSGAKISCFEPEPRAAARFLVNVRDLRANLFTMALGREDGEKTFYRSGGLPSGDWAGLMPQGWDLSGSLRNPSGHLVVHPWCTFNEQMLVHVARLDTWSQKHRVKFVDFIWADVQGAEEDLIIGGIETLNRTRYFFTEYSNQELYEGQITLDAILKMLPEFTVVDVYPNDVLLRNVRLT